MVQRAVGPAPGTPDQPGASQGGGARRRFTALVLAGERPHGDPLVAQVGLSHKALMPVHGVPMLTRVVRALRAARSVGRVLVCGVDAGLLQGQQELGALLSARELTLIDSRPTPSASVLHAVERFPQSVPLLVTTADHALLTPEMIDYFCERALADDCDAAVGLVRAELVRSAFPLAKRTYLRFRDQAYCGGNLFALLTPAGQRAPAAWMEIEQHRKRPWRMIRALGLVVLLQFVLRRLTLDAALQHASAKIHARARAILLPYPEAAVDVDTPSDLRLVEALLRSRTDKRDG